MDRLISCEFNMDTACGDSRNQCKRNGGLEE